MESPQPGGEYAGYRAVLADAARRTPSNWTFKSNPTYREILEHVSPEQGEAYLALVREEFPQLWHEGFIDCLKRLAQSNDSVGSPVAAFFPEYDLICSPTNLRYAYHALRVLAHAQQFGRQYHFIELGAGYGGLALYVSELSNLFDIDICSYTTIDVPEACFIQQTFAHLQMIHVETADGTEASQLIHVIDRTSLPSASRFLISAYAFSEFSDSIQAWYREAIVNHCDHGFLVWNLRPLFKFTSKLCTVEHERPLTGYGNMYVSF